MLAASNQSAAWSTFSWPARQIAINAGEDGSVIVGKIQDNDTYAFGCWIGRLRASLPRAPKQATPAKTYYSLWPFAAQHG